MAVRVVPSAQLAAYVRGLSETPARPLPDGLRRLRDAAGDDEEVHALSGADLRFLADLIRREERPTAYLHQLVRDSRLELPTPPAPAPRDPELERRVQRLRKEQEQRQYQRMVANVAASSRKFDVDDESFAAQMKQVNKQLVEVLGFAVTVAAAFLFGFLGVDLMVGPLDLGVRFLLGAVVALIVAVAEVYFMARVLGDQELFHDAKSQMQRKKLA